MLELHQLVARAMVLYYAIIGIWGIILAVRKAAPGPSYRGALVIGVVIGVLQAIEGVVLLVNGLRPADNLHYLYGASVIVTLPLVASYLADRKFSRALGYGLASLFMAGLAIRAITTGGVA